MKRRILILAAMCAVLLLLAGTAGADVTISEVMASNGTYENAEAYDWVEMYNDGNKAVDIGG